MVAEKIRELLSEVVPKGTDFSVERPQQAGHGDYATNAALVAAKTSGKNPRVLAEELATKLAKHDLFSNVSVAGPGFVNFVVSPKAWQNALQQILTDRGDYGRFPPTHQKTQVEFISANPTGPLTLGNGRGGFGGDVLANVLSLVGHAVEREYYINDAGNQIVSLGKTLRGDEKLYAGDYVDELASKVNVKNPAEVVGAEGAGVMLEDIKQTTQRMGIRFDAWFSETSVYTSGRVSEVLEMLGKAGATYESEDALWLKTAAQGDDKDRVLRKADGEFTYLAADIAHYYENFVTGRLDRKINILGADHHGYVARMQAAVELLRQATSFTGESTIIITQLVRLIRDGKEVKMSKRAGTYVALEELLDEIDVDVARFFFVMKSFDTHMDFDLDLAKEQSQKNPVFYVKYAHARICSIMAKSDLKDAPADLRKLTQPAECALIRELAEFPAIIQRTAADYQVQRLPHYALGLADVFHNFYETCQVITADEELTKARLQLVRATRIVLQNVGETLGISMPERM